MVGQQIGEAGGVVLRHLHQYRRKIGLWINRAIAVGFPVQMNGEAGYIRHGLAKIDQCVFHRPGLIHVSDPTRQGQVTIKPGIQQHAAVHFHTQLEKPLAAQFRVGFHLQTGAVGVGTHHTNTGFRGVAATSAERHDG